MGGKFDLKLVRSFSLGVSIHSPTLNGLYVEFHFSCFHFVVRNRPAKWFSFNNYWSG